MISSNFSKILLSVCLLVIICSQNASGAKILSVAFMGSRSHKITYDALLEELAQRGHDVTVVSTVPSKKNVSNIRNILTFDVDELTAQMPNMFEQKEQNQNFNPLDIVPLMVKLCHDTLDLPEIKALQSEKFDLIYVPAIMNECTLAYAHTFKTSIIIISPLGVPSSVSQYFGNPSPASFVPNIFLGYSEKMTFYERTANLLGEAFWREMISYMMVPAVEAAYRSKLGQDMPSIYEMFTNANMIFSNSHFSIASTRPFLPDIVEVGGMHCRPAIPLPKDLEDFISTSGEHGFILFSMGSLLKASTMREEKRKMLLAVFSKLKQKVIWKWETEEMDDLPPNVKLSKWLPQQDVLGHPKVRAFITHGGFGSTTEAVYHGVPVVGIPMFGDQVINMETASRLEFGVVLDFNTFTDDSLFEAVNKIITDSKYKKKASEISRIFRDQPDQPLARAVFWSEYVIRHNGALHLRSSARKLNFFQYHSIDVLAFIALVLATVVFVVVKIVLLLFRLISTLIFSKFKQKLLIGKKTK